MRNIAHGKSNSAGLIRQFLYLPEREENSEGAGEGVGLGSGQLEEAARWRRCLSQALQFAAVSNQKGIDFYELRIERMGWEWGLAGHSWPGLAGIASRVTCTNLCI